MTFKFDSVDDFDKHINLSIPNYDGLIEVVSSVALEYLTPDGGLLDVGCSTGSLASKINGRSESNVSGCDIVDFREHNDFNFILDSAANAINSQADLDVITSIFTLQFMGRRERKRTIDGIKAHVEKGCIAIIAEKIHLDNPRLNTALYRTHQRCKLEGFTAKDILEKDLSLAGAMFPLSINEIEKELSEIGTAHSIWQSYNFRCWAIIGEVNNG